MGKITPTIADGFPTLLDDWAKARANAKTPEEKSRYNVWDDFKKDVLPVLKLALTGKWTWWKNQKCKYITVRIDMRDGGCIIKDNEGNRINPEDLASQIDT
jgi:hypothetical protein